MAKANRTTNPSRRRVRTRTTSTAQAAEILCRLEDEAHAEAFGLGHLGELMRLMGDCVGTPRAGWTDMQMQKIGLRIEYLGELVKRHADQLSKTLGEIRTTAERMEGGAQ